LEVYKWFVAKEKALYLALNNMNQGSSTYIGYFWAPLESEQTILEQLRSFPTTDMKRYESHTIKPPTYIKTNDFLYPF
jgi:vacuolar-type H+-ATPase subunit I/STV1